jgi:hypothetical protein
VTLILISFSLSSINATDSDHLSVYAADSPNTSMSKFIPLYNQLTHYNSDFVILNSTIATTTPKPPVKEINICF